MLMVLQIAMDRRNSYQDQGSIVDKIIIPGLREVLILFLLNIDHKLIVYLYSFNYIRLD